MFLKIGGIDFPNNFLFIYPLTIFVDKLLSKYRGDGSNYSRSESI